jgi:hypothetical protein
VSLTESMTDFPMENGRRYHRYHAGCMLPVLSSHAGLVILTDLAYRYPCDEDELDRMDMLHAMVKLVCEGSLHLSPLNNPQRILDVGAGSGIWAMEMGTIISAQDYCFAELNIK